MRAALVTLLSTVLFTLHVGAAWAAALDQGGSAQRVLELTNVERHHAGLGPLVLNARLTEAAQKYTEVLASGDCFAHTCGAVPDFSVRIKQTGYVGWSGIAENIAAGYPTPEAVIAGWMGSPGHRENILTPSFTELGVGVVGGVGGKFGTFWTQEFGARAAARMDAPVAPEPAFAPVAADPAVAAGAADEPGPAVAPDVTDGDEPMSAPAAEDASGDGVSS